VHRNPDGTIPAFNHPNGFEWCVNAALGVVDANGTSMQKPKTATCMR